MPKVVDHDARRTTIVEAALAVIVERGLEGATMRRIAQEAGSTTGLVTHYFASKDEVLIAALRHVHRAAGARMIEAMRNREGIEALRAVIEESLPLDDARRAEWKIWLAFWGHAPTAPALAIEQQQRYEEWTDLLAQLVVDAGLDTSVTGLVAVIDGIGVRATITPDGLPPSEQLAVVGRVLASSPASGRLSP